MHCRNRFRHNGSDPTCPILPRHPLSSCHVRSVLADNRHLVEISGASWLASRARLAYMRNLHLGEIDSLQLLTDNCAHPTRMVRVRPLISADASTRFACSCCLLQPDVTAVECASASRRRIPGPVGCAPTRCGTNRHMDTCSRNFAFAWRVAVDLCTQAQGS